MKGQIIMRKLSKVVSLTLASALVLAAMSMPTSVKVLADPVAPVGANQEETQIVNIELSNKKGEVSESNPLVYGQTIKKIVIKFNKKLDLAGKNLYLYLKGVDGAGASTDQTTYTFDNLNINTADYNSYKFTAGLEENQKNYIHIYYGESKDKSEYFDEISFNINKMKVSELLDGVKFSGNQNTAEYFGGVLIEDYDLDIKSHTMSGALEIDENRDDNRLYLTIKGELASADADNTPKKVTVTDVKIDGLYKDWYEFDKEAVLTKLNENKLDFTVTKADISTAEQFKNGWNDDLDVELGDDVNASVDAEKEYYFVDPFLPSDKEVKVNGKMSYKINGESGKSFDALKADLKKHKLGDIVPYEYEFKVDDNDKNFKGSVKGKLEYYFQIAPNKVKKIKVNAFKSDYREGDKLDLNSLRLGLYSDNEGKKLLQENSYYSRSYRFKLDELEKLEERTLTTADSKEYTIKYVTDYKNEDNENDDVFITAKVKINVAPNSGNSGVIAPMGGSTNTQSTNTSKNDEVKKQETKKNDEKALEDEDTILEGSEGTKTVKVSAKAVVKGKVANVTVSDKALKKALSEADDSTLVVKADTKKSNLVKLSLDKKNISTLKNADIKKIEFKNGVASVLVNRKDFAKLVKSAKDGVKIVVAKENAGYHVYFENAKGQKSDVTSKITVVVKAKKGQKIYLSTSKGEKAVKTTYDSKKKSVKAVINVGVRFVVK